MKEMQNMNTATVNAAQENMMNTIEKKVKEMLMNKENFLSNIFVGVQQNSTDPIVKDYCDDFDGIEKYIYVRVEQDNSVAHCKITEAILNDIDLSIDDAWKYAHHNTEEETLLVNLREKMKEMLGLEFDEDTEEPAPIYIVTNKSNIRGASAILNKKLIKAFAKKMNVDKLIVLPSSIHEMLIIPYNEFAENNFCMEDMNDMVSVINATEVTPKERLTSRAYLIEV